MSRALVLAGVAFLAACGVKAAPRPPLPEGAAAEPSAVSPGCDGCLQPSTTTPTSTSASASTSTKKP